MISSSNTSQKEAFLSLVRLGIGCTDSTVPEMIDWESVRVLADEQELTAIVLDGIQVLADRGELVNGRAIDSSMKKQWIGTMIRNYEQRFWEYRKRIGQLAHFFNSHGFKMMVLKGYGLNLDYPIPQHRPCGDIDIWSFGKYREADADLSAEYAIPVDTTHHHHTVFSFKGFAVENHYDFVNVHYGHGNAGLEKIFKELAMDDSVKIEIDGETVYLPSSNFHALFVLRHNIGHFASTGMPLRQILDWAFLIEKHSAEIDWPWFLQVLDKYRMTEFFNCMNAICVQDIGFDSSIFPSYAFDSELKNRVLNDILSPEFNQPTPRNLLKRIPFKYRRWQANAWKQNLCYGDSRFMSFWAGVWSHLLKPGMI